MNSSSLLEGGQPRTGRGGRRARLVARVIELAPVVRRVFEVRPDPEQRALWQSLTVHQLEALVVLDAGTCTMRELCERLDISESAGTALSDRLVGRGLVERLPDPADRRLVRLALSDHARSMVAQYRALKQRRMADLLAAVDTDDLATLVRIFETVLAPDGPGRKR